MFKKWLLVYVFVIATCSSSVGATPGDVCTAHNNCGSAEYCYTVSGGIGACSLCYSNNGDAGVCGVYGNSIDSDCSACSSPSSPPPPPSPGGTCSGSGSINVSSSCSEYNCFDGAHIVGADISCDTGFSEAQCADKCCSQSNCKGFDYSAIDHGSGAGRCCTSYVSRFEGGVAFEHNGGTYRSCEKNSVTCSSPPLPPSYSPTPSPTGSSVACWFDIVTESNNGKKCFEKSCPPLHTKGGDWCKLHEMAEKVCCGDDCCEPNAGAIAGAVIGAVIGVTLLIVSSCYCGRCGCFRYRRDQLLAAAAATRLQQPQVVYVQQASPAKVVASV